MAGVHVVTGAFGYSGKYIAQRLLDAGCAVITLTNSPKRANPFGGRIEAFPLNFDKPDRLIERLRGAQVLYNTYWVRFNHRDFKYAEAVNNTLVLIDAARKACVPRIVHISITNPSEDSPFEYFRGKARLERALVESGLSHAILRPTVLFGREDILINNIAWVLRRFPVFGVFGDGAYRLQPIHVDDLAHLAVEQGRNDNNVVVDAIGPESFSFRELVGNIGAAIGKPRRLVAVPPRLALVAGKLIGWMVRDVIITADEIAGLRAGLLCTNSPPAGTTRLTQWVRENADQLGRRYASELARRRDRYTAYGQL